MERNLFLHRQARHLHEERSSPAIEKNYTPL
jgi:hypothetical protein